MNIVKDYDIILKKDDVFKMINVTKDSPSYQTMSETYDDLEPKAKAWARPRGYFLFEDMASGLEDEEFGSCSHLVTCICTIGDEITRQVNDLFGSGQALEGYLLDTMGDKILMDFTDSIYENIKEEARRRGLGLTVKYSPGNAIPIDWQKPLIEKFNKIVDTGVRTSGGYMLEPVKSASFLYGADKGLDIPVHDHECSRCPSLDCPVRREAYQGA